MADKRIALRHDGELEELAREVIADHDLWIASIAIQYDLALITNDAHFERIPELKRA